MLVSSVFFFFNKSFFSSIKSADLLAQSASLVASKPSSVFLLSTKAALNLANKSKILLTVS